MNLPCGGKTMKAKMNSKSIQLVARWVANAESHIAFTGAGISTESGIPDFRSSDGIWTKFQPVYFDDFLASAKARHEYWRQKLVGHSAMVTAAPNNGHQVLARWETNGQIKGIITQNIDGLHQLAGSERVLELHGNARKITCIDCEAFYEADPLMTDFQRTGSVPPCPGCNGRLKHATVSFGQTLPAEILNEAIDWSGKCDLFLAMGSSLTVTPAANLPQLAKQGGARLVIINRDPTGLDALADVVIHHAIGETLLEIDDSLQH